MGLSNQFYPENVSEEQPQLKYLGIRTRKLSSIRQYRVLLLISFSGNYLSFFFLAVLFVAIASLDQWLSFILFLGWLRRRTC